jgi:hypothetical protein
MRKLLSLVVVTTAPLFLLAQKNKDKNPNLPPFGTVTKADLEMKQCDFDEKAEAMILIEEGALDFIVGKGIELKKRVRIKIFNNKGAEWANIHLSYLSERNAQDITNLEAQTYNLDANGNIVVSKVDKKLVYEKKLSKRYTEKAFTFPDVKPGSIIEYKYKHDGIGLIDWYFQRGIPVKYSHFVMDFPTELEVANTPFCSRQFEWDKKESSNRVTHTYSMSNVPAFRDEPFIINEDYYRDRIETKVIAVNLNGRRENMMMNWIQVIKILMEDEDFGVQLKKNIPRTADLDAKLKGISSSYEKMKVIYKYVQDNMQWNEYLGIWALDGVKNAWKDKKGTVGEINLILVNFLKDAGLNAHPVLVSTHDNGIINTVDAGTYLYPAFYRFDKVMAYITIDGKAYVLDATQKNVPVHLIPSDVLLTQGLVIEKIETFDWGWKTLWNENSVSKNLLMINGTIDESGKMTGVASLNSYDYARISRMNTAKKGKDKYIENFITASNPSMTVSDVKFENIEADSLPLVQTIQFTQQLNSTGDYNYFSANVLTGLENNPFVSDNRFSDVFFGYNQSYTILGNYNLPDGFEYDQLPKNIKMIMPDTSIVVSRISAVTENTLQTRIQIDFKKPVYAADQYPDLQEFYQRMFDILNEQFVYRKKKK